MSGHQMPKSHYLNDGHGLKSWLLTFDHKRIALLYLLHHASSSCSAAFADTYNKLFTMHGMVMVFFFLIPAIPAVLGNFLLPMMIGAKDLAFPRLNLLSWYVFMLGGCWPCRHALGGVDTGWTFYTPYSSTYSNGAVMPGPRHLHRRLLLDPHRPQLHRHHPQDAGAGPDLVPPAAVRLGPLRHQPHQVLAPRCSPSRSAAALERLSASASSTRPSAATRCSSSTSSGSTRTRRSTS
jgi:hypothetical protein